MKLIIQRVNQTSVAVSGKIVGQISKGLFVLVGIKDGDSKNDALELSKKLVKLRIMSDKNNKMNLSVLDTSSEILVVSQFTLYADTKGGNRPSFIKAAEPSVAREIYEHFVSELEKLGAKVATGEFGSYMNIDAKIDGPVTIVLET
jgi:D-tyrosyl-tRNA(Tyr) deacylase